MAVFFTSPDARSYGPDPVRLEHASRGPRGYLVGFFTEDETFSSPGRGKEIFRRLDVPMKGDAGIPDAKSCAVRAESHSVEAGLTETYSLCKSCLSVVVGPA